MQLVQRVEYESVEIVETEEKEVASVLSPCLERIKDVRAKDGKILTKPFLDFCNLFLHVLDKFGTSMALVKSDVAGNISKLESKYSTDPARYALLHSMVEEYLDSKTTKDSADATVGLLWLTRSMDFLVELFRNLLEHPDWSMSQACNESYSNTLKNWHGWFTSSSFMVGMKLIPDKEKFMDIMGGEGYVEADMERFYKELAPLLEENQKTLENVDFYNSKAP